MANNNYTINFVDDTKSSIEILTNGIVGPSGSSKETDIDLIGMGHSLWGESILENLIHILENFSCEEDMHDILAITSNTTLKISGSVIKSFNNISNFVIIEAGSPSTTISFTLDGSNLPSYDSINDETTITITAGDLTTVTLPAAAGTQGRPNQSLFFSPTLPVQGQVWYNQTTGQINVWDGSWKRVGGITISSIEPANPSEGDFWWDTSTSTIPTTADFGRNLQIYLTVGGWQRVVQDYLPRDGSKVMTNHLNVGGNRIEGLADPDSNDPQHAMTFGYAEINYVNVQGDSMTGDLDMGSTNTIINVANPVNPGDAVPFGYADNRFLNATGDNMTGALSMGTNKITTTYVPVDPEDVVNLQYIQSNVTTLDVIYPIGSVYISMLSSFDPNVVFVGMTWARIAEGRMLVGQDPGDPIFDAERETGGSKNAINISHTHSMQNNGSHSHLEGEAHDYNGAQYGYVNGSAMLQSHRNQWNVYRHAYTSTNGLHAHTINSSGSSGTNSNLPPYLVTYMWERTA